MSQSFIGQIIMFAGNFAPRNYALCNGQTLSIAQNNALFALLGTFYGGNGVSTFALPNLQSQVPVHQGSGLGLSSYVIGQNGGVASVTIDRTTLPAHTHTLNATTATATTATIANTMLPAQPTVGNPPALYASQIGGDPTLIPVTLAAGALATAGGNQAHTNLMPSLCITFAIALLGVFPSRN